MSFSMIVSSCIHVAANSITLFFFRDTIMYKKDLHDPDNHDGVITHLEPDILDVKSSGP